MKTQHTKGNAHPPNKFPGILAALVLTLLSFNALPKARGVDLFWTGNATSPALAGSGTWVNTIITLPPFSWSTTATPQTGATWTDGSVANFVGTGGGTATLGSSITAAGINFQPGANSFIIQTNNNVLTIQGTGIANTSGTTETLTNNGGTTPTNAGRTLFSGTTISGTMTTINNNAGTAIGTANGTAGGFINFLAASSAGSATITNTGGAVEFSGGATSFGTQTEAATATAGHATITNNGGTAGGSGGVTDFFSTSNAGSATITNNAGTGIGSEGATQFFGSSNAGNATIISNGGTGVDSGGLTFFFGTSDGGTARAITNGNGGFDISGLTTDGMGIGSIEGSGNYFLGGKTLTVGGNDATTTVSGVIQDGGTDGGAGGSLTKIGAGTLTLTGTNTYSGGTNLNAGILAVNSDANLGTGPLSFDGGTLEALSTGPGLFSGKVITLNGGGGTFLADAGTISTLSGMISGIGSLTKTGAGTLTLTEINAYNGGTNINGGILAVNSDANLGAGALSFNGGTLEALAAGGGITSSKLITLNALGGTFQADGGTSSTLSGVISGTGGLVETGTGSLSLTGLNTYSGGTTFNGGILAVNSDANLGTGALSFNGGTLEALGPGGGIVSGKAITLNAGGGTFLADAGSSSTLRGVISGTGSLTKNGLGILTLTGANTYIGGTNLNGGILAVNSDVNLGTGALSFNGGTLEALSPGGGIVSGKAITLNVGGGTFLADPSTSSTLRGRISGGGSLAKNGPGTLILTGTNTYTGGTKINAGTVQVGNGGTTGSITGDVVDDGTLAFDRSDSITFGRVISGTGNLVQEGTGTLTVTAANTYTGTTTVDSGTLIVSGSVASAQTIVNSGAFLGGHGTIGGNLVNSGTVSQINSPGTLMVTGNYTQNPGGTLRIGVAGVAPGQHDLLAVGGHATLGGTLQLISLGGFSLQPGNQITFLTANNGVSGTFSNTQNGLVSTGTIVQAQVATTSNSAVLVTTEGSFTNTPGVATNSNNVAVAKALDSARGDPREAALFAFLNSQPLANLPNDLTLIAPTQISSINATAVSVAKVQIANVAMRLAAVHAGSTGFSSAGLSINSGVSFEGLAGPSGSEGKSGPAVFAPTPDNRWGVFLTGLGEFTNVYSTPEASGYDVDTGGFTFGVDYRLTPNIAIGLTGGYAHTTVNLDAGGNINVNGGKLGAYATIFGNGFYLDTAVTGGPSGYQTRRTALQGTASGNTGGADFNVMVAGGYDWTKGNLSIGPTASFQYSYVGLNSFTESGSLAPLTFPNQNTQSELSAFGAKATYNWKIGKVIVLPQISAAWQHEYGATAYSVIAGFASGAGNNFTVTGPNIGRDSLLIGTGATVILSDRVSTYLYYDGEFARTNYLSNNVSGGVRVSF